MGDRLAMKPEWGSGGTGAGASCGGGRVLCKGRAADHSDQFAELPHSL